MKSIFTYIDFRRFLKDYYEEAKAEKKYFSYRYFSRRAGINSPNFLKVVIEGRRNLTRNTIEKFTKGLGFGEKEAVFFRHLVLFNQAKTSSEKQENYLILKEMANQVRQKVIGADYFEYFNSWYVSVVRELACQKNWGNDYSALGAALRPKISGVQARDAIDLLLRLGLLARDEQGALRQTDSAIATESQIASLAVRNYNKKMIDLAQHAIDELPLDKRYASGLTMGMSRDCYGVLLAEIDAFKDRIVTIVNSYGNSDSVYQLNLQLFPLVQKQDEKDPAK